MLNENNDPFRLVEPGGVLDVSRARYADVDGRVVASCWSIARVTAAGVGERSRALRDAGHSVSTPTLTGLGERRHSRSAALSLDTFVVDIANVINAEEPRDVTLVGHSFGGVVIGGVADRVPDDLRRLVYLDAVTPLASESLLDMMPYREREGRLAALALQPDGAVQAPPPTEHFGISDTGQAMWVDRHLTPHPVGGSPAAGAGRFGLATSLSGY